MTFIQFHPSILMALTFIVALMYSAVGHGGASGYLALMSLTDTPHEISSTLALILNLIVSSISFMAYVKERHFSISLTWPFLAASIPLAFFGGTLKLPPETYSLLLAAVLLYLAFRMLKNSRANTTEISPPLEFNTPSLTISLLIGGGIGLLSGMLGIGGGIFLSPLMITLNWSSPKQVSATAACFILVNSAAGLLGRFGQDQYLLTRIYLNPNLLWLLVPAIVGGLLGARYGSRYASNPMLCRLLGVVLLIAAVKLFLP